MKNLQTLILSPLFQRVRKEKQNNSYRLKRTNFLPIGESVLFYIEARELPNKALYTEAFTDT